MIQDFLLRVRRKEKWYHKLIYETALHLRYLRLPFPKVIGGILFYARSILLVLWRRLKQFFYYEPMFRFRCNQVGKGVYFESNFPLIMGYGSIFVGNRVRISGNVNLFVSYKVNPNPTIQIGDDVYLGYGSIYSCADKIRIGNRVLIAQGASIYDNNNHPLDPKARAENKPVERGNVAPVVIEDDVWIGSNAVILKGVTVGRGAIIATEAVVANNVPPMTIVAGNPAKVVKHLKDDNYSKKLNSDKLRKRRYQNASRTPTK